MTRTLLRQWQSMTTTDIEQLAERDPVAILPVAAIEQHGPHLPLSTDLDIGLGLLAAASTHLDPSFPAVMLPAVAIGTSGEHARHAGTLSVEPSLLADILFQLGVSLHRAGFRRLVYSNSHGGNVAALNMTGLRLRVAHQLLVIKTHYFFFPGPDTVSLPAAEWRHGLHGGAVETSMMLHLHPDRVRRGHLSHRQSLGERLDTTLHQVGAENPAASFSWVAGDLHPSGATGHAELADPAIGRALVEYYGERLAGVIRDARAFPIDALT